MYFYILIIKKILTTLCLCFILFWIVLNYLNKKVDSLITENVELFDFSLKCYGISF